MRERHWRGFLVLCVVVMAGCVEQRPALSPTEAIALLRSGEPLLHCRDACLAQWRASQPQATQLDQIGRWGELAALLLHVGYQDDLSLYYLGRAAEGAGYPAAAASYYRQSVQLSGTAASCRYLSGQCGGVALPGAASLRLAVLEQQLRQPRGRLRGGHPRRPSEAPEPTAGEVSAPVAPPAAPEPVPAVPLTLPAILSPPVVPPAGPAPRPAIPPGPPPSEYIEPPAAR